MMCGTAPAHDSATMTRPGGGTISGVCVYAVTASGNLHIMCVSDRGIALQHIIPSMQTGPTGAAPVLQEVIAAAMQVRIHHHARVFRAFTTAASGSRFHGHVCARPVAF